MDVLLSKAGYTIMILKKTTNLFDVLLLYKTRNLEVTTFHNYKEFNCAFI